MKKIGKKLKIEFKWSSIFKVILGTYLMAFAFYFFFEKTKIITGGVGGLGIIIKEALINAAKESAKESVRGYNISYFVFAANFGLLILGLFLLGKKFFFKSVFLSIFYPFILFLLEQIGKDKNFFVYNFNLPLQSAKILSALFGAILSGMGLGLVFGAGLTTGGTDVIQKIFHKYFKIPMSVAIYLTDGLIVVLGLIVFEIEIVLYSIIAVILIGVVVDKFMVLGKRGYTVFVVTNKCELVKKEIIEKLDRGFTKIDVKGGFTEDGKTMIVCTVGKNEVYLLKEIVSKTDPESFSFFVETTEVVGSGFERKE